MYWSCVEIECQCFYNKKKYEQHFDFSWEKLHLVISSCGIR